MGNPLEKSISQHSHLVNAMDSLRCIVASVERSSESDREDVILDLCMVIGQLCDMTDQVAKGMIVAHQIKDLLDEARGLVSKVERMVM